jgi:hypothetical protein
MNHTPPKTKAAHTLHTVTRARNVTGWLAFVLGFLLIGMV